LDDHVFEGVRLFPAVMGLEAMAQAAMAITGATSPPRFENVRFDRPVAVPDTGQTIRVAALIRKPGVVDVTLRCRETGFEVDHFRAAGVMPEAEDAVPATSSNGRHAVVAGRPAAPSGEPAVAADRAAAPALEPPVALDPSRDLYSTILFHR